MRRRRRRRKERPLAWALSILVLAMAAAFLLPASSSSLLLPGALAAPQPAPLMTDRLAAQLEREEEKSRAGTGDSEKGGRQGGQRRRSKASVVSADIGIDGMVLNDPFHPSSASPSLARPHGNRPPPRGPTRPPISAGRQQVEDARRLQKEKTKHLKPRAYLGDGEGLSFCVHTEHCSDPYYEGTLLETWHSHWGPRGYRVAGELALGVPNDGSAVAKNHAHVDGSILLLERGGVTFLTKAKNAQAAGALAVVIADHQGQCGEDFSCGGAVGTRSQGQGLAYSDSRSDWSVVRIPVVMISKSSYDRIRLQLEPLLHRVETEEFGMQTVLDA